MHDITGVTSASEVVCIVLILYGSFKASVIDLLNRRPVCWFLVAGVLVTVVLDNCVALTLSCIAYGITI